MYVGLRGSRRRSFSASSSKITATCRRLTALKSSENLTTMVKQCRELFCPSARKSQPADRPRKDLNHPLIRRNIAGAVGISSLSWPCMYLGFLAMYRGMKSIKPTIQRSSSPHTCQNVPVGVKVGYNGLI